MTETKFTFKITHPVESDILIILFKNTTTERIRTGRKYWLQWFMMWDYETYIPIARREFTERALVKDYYEIIEIVNEKFNLANDKELSATRIQLLDELKRFEPAEW